MKYHILIPLSALALAFIPGCATAPGSAIYTNPTNSSTAVVNLNKINIQDWDAASDQMIQSLLNSEVLSKAPKSPAIFAIDRIVNKTTDANLDTELLSKNIRIALNKSGKVLTTTTYGNLAESRMSQDVQAKNDFLNSDSSHAQDHSPDFALSGKIIEDSARAGETRQTTYIFQLSLTDTHSGLAVWEDQKMIQKTGTRSQVGW
jgi:penicillin-binding protein activator